MLGGDSLTGTTFTHANVIAGTTYYYSIRALNAAGEASGWLLDYPFATALPATANGHAIAHGNADRRKPREARSSRSTSQPAATAGRTTKIG